MIKPLICAIAAMDENRVIGNGDQLPNWNIPEDMEYLREITNGYPLIMGRATHESICKMRDIDPYRNRAMPGRLNIVISRQNNYFEIDKPDYYRLASTPDSGLRLAYDFAANAGMDKIFIFGGAKIYGELLLQTERLFLTEVEGCFEGDACFPELDMQKWKRISHDPHDNGHHKFAFNIYDRVKP